LFRAVIRTQKDQENSRLVHYRDGDLGLLLPACLQGDLRDDERRFRSDTTSVNRRLRENGGWAAGVSPLSGRANTTDRNRAKSLSREAVWFTRRVDMMKALIPKTPVIA
jgi:hypothetical protein